MNAIFVAYNQAYNQDLLDLNGDPEMSSISPEMRSVYMNDAAHPNKKGYVEWWLPKFEKALSDMLSDNG